MNVRSNMYWGDYSTTLELPCESLPHENLAPFTYHDHIDYTALCAMAGVTENERLAASASAPKTTAATTLSTEEQNAYEKTISVLRTPASFLAPIGSVVNLRNAVENPPLDEQEGVATTLLTPNRGHHALFRALEELEGLEKQEAELFLQSSLTTTLTTIVTGEEYTTPRQAVGTLEALCRSIPRRVCQHPFKRNDIVWVCRTCQADETCVLCHNCFTNSNHEGHDVAFYHAQAGGCCDCGDPDAWDPQGFCPHHGPTSGKDHGMPQDLVERVMGVVPATVDWMVQKVAKTAEEGHLRSRHESESGTQGKGKEASEGSSFSPTFQKHAHTFSNLHHMPPMEEALFSPLAAGSMKVNREKDEESQIKPPAAIVSRTPLSKAERLGILARDGGGLFLVLKSDDIHSESNWIDTLRDLLGTSSLYTDSILKKFVKALRQFGQLVVWGTMELLAEFSSTQLQLWLDGDRVVSGIIGQAMLNKANLLTSRGLYCAILTLDELKSEQQAVAVLQWLTCLARSCDPLCQTVAESIAPERHLVPLLRADFKLSSRITKYWHSLLLTLLAVPTFKSHLAAAYCDTYQSVTAEYARGMGVLERSGYALSVQFLNRVTYVVDLVQRRNLLGKLGASLLETLRVAAKNPQNKLDPNHFVMTHRRYSPCISDLKCVLNVKGMPRLFASEQGTFLKDWISALSLGQMMDVQVFRDWSQGHVELEVRGWVGAFNASISLGSLFERLLSWDDSDPSPIDDPNSPLSKNLMSCVELTSHVLTSGVAKWQMAEMANYKPTSYTVDASKRKPASLPFSTVSVRHGSLLAFKALPVAQATPFSFHLPLQRFVAACLRELCLREDGINGLKRHLSQRLSADDHNSLFMGLMEFPVLVLSRAAQVRAGLWRRNGNGLNDQVLNYAEPPFCRAMRDADLLLAQFAMLGRMQHQTTDCRPDSDVGVCFLVHLLLHRLGLFDFCGLAKGPHSDINRYLDEVQKRLYNPELNSDKSDEDFFLPWTYSPARDAASRLLLLEEFLHTMIILCTELPPEPPLTKKAHTAQAKQRLRREVIHRLASGSKTHSELAEVHHVLSHWDNVFLSEEGKLVNPDDATGAALGTVLAEVAARKVSRGKMEPDKWELENDCWESYDPSFFHISLRSHQTAAELRPAPSGSNANYGVLPKAFCPSFLSAHSSFARLRRDITCDSTVLAIAYRTLHVHCRDTRKTKDMADLRGSMAYETDERSETALARAVHLLTLGAFAWQNAKAEDMDWRSNGGGSIGSLFFDRGDDVAAPTAREWVSIVMLANPRNIMASEWYEGEESCLQLLRRLAVDGGFSGGFVAQDQAVRAGAAWLCEFAAEHNMEARRLVRNKDAAVENSLNGKTHETEMDKRKRIAKEKAMERMKAQAAKFASMMEAELGEKDENEVSDKEDKAHGSSPSPRPTANQGSLGTLRSSGSSVASNDDSDKGNNRTSTSEANLSSFDEAMIPSRLLFTRPQCIICSDDGTGEAGARGHIEDRHRKSRKRRADGGNALAFVGYTQASTVLKGGGGPASSSNFYGEAPVRRFVGAHVALCGHAVHSECWESYLATVSHREDRNIGKRDEFRCPLCQRLSNCLVPFIDVGVDWIDSAVSCLPLSMPDEESNVKAGDTNDTMCHQNASSTLSSFLKSTPWWVSRHNSNAVWDGQCAFLSKPSSMYDHTDDDPPLASVKESRRKSVRPLRKKDLYAAWNAVMKSPRFVRRKLKPRGDVSTDEAKSMDGNDGSTNHFSVSADSAGETLVWRRFMDQVSDITYRADGKRLGDESLHNDFGEFRHYIVEKYAYNMANRFAGKEASDVSSVIATATIDSLVPLLTFGFFQWPSCVFSSPLSDVQRQELSREKLLSKFMMSIQAFTYSCCCEAYEARRLIRKSKSSSKQARVSPADDPLGLIFSKFGIDSLACDGSLVIMPRPSASDDNGSQPFSGRLGRLRYLGLAVMAAAGPLAADLIQLALSFPLASDKDSSSARSSNQPRRAPIVYPILLGNVLTHVVAAICASNGRARARSDSLELIWPVPFSRSGSFVFSSDDSVRHMQGNSVVEDAEGFLKLGLLARMLQVLLGKLDIQGLDKMHGIETEFLVVRSLQNLKSSGGLDDSSLESRWKLACVSLLEKALPKHSRNGDALEQPHLEQAILDRLEEGCSLAAAAACSYLADVGIVVQLVVPGIMANYSNPDGNGSFESMHNDDNLATLEKLQKCFRIEPVSDMLLSESVSNMVSHWYKDARRHEKASSSTGEIASGSGATTVGERLFRTQGFRIFDWPMESCEYSIGSKSSSSSSQADHPDTAVSNGEAPVPMAIDSLPAAVIPPGSSELQRVSPSLVTFSSNKSMRLIGGYSSELFLKANGRPRVAMIPTSYTDLYAELGQLLPDSEQTAVCLICGEVLNAGGKGECTRHSFKCGAGTGMFFLLQDCAGLIMHNSKAAYIHSPYVDSHGETPQYRGRPLNLDLDRYDHLQEVWRGHAVRQQVLAERGRARQIIVQDFY
eukprot:scaffold19_cov114-Cylindrotheca_fusiformis.AAC.44